MNLPWEKSIVDEIGNVHQVWCAICSNVERKEKLFVLKLDSLLEHTSRHKTKVSKLEVMIGSFYFDLKSEHT
jgi:hypothetical protein